MEDWNWKEDKRCFNIEKYNYFILENTHFTKEYYEAKKIIISDCDGVLTNGKSAIGFIDYHNIKKIFKEYGSYDKEALKFMQSMNWDFIFVTDDNAGFNITLNRLQKWFDNNNDTSFLKSANYIKRKNLIDYCHELDYQYIIFIGDSVSDLYVLNSEHLTDFYCPGNALDIVKNNDRVKWVTRRYGGDGAFAEILYYIHEDINGKIITKAKFNQTTKNS